MGHCSQLPSLAQAVAPCKTEQQANEIDLEQIGQILRIAFPEKLLKIFKKNLAVNILIKLLSLT